MGEPIFPKVFPLFFPLAVFTVRTIWYIRYILKTDLNLMIPDVVVWQLMDRAKQIRIPHPLPNNKNHTRRVWFLLFVRCGIRTNLNADVQWTSACRRSRRRQHNNVIESLIPYPSFFHTQYKISQNIDFFRIQSYKTLKNF